VGLKSEGRLGKAGFMKILFGMTGFEPAALLPKLIWEAWSFSSVTGLVSMLFMSRSSGPNSVHLSFGES
jgi:hypothetical protein